MARLVRTVEELSTALDGAGDKLVIIDFFASWCAPCKVMGPILDDIASEDVNLVALKVDINQSEDLAEEYNISVLPTFIFMRGKKIIGTFVGANDSKLKEDIQLYKAGQAISKGDVKDTSVGKKDQ